MSTISGHYVDANGRHNMTATFFNDMIRTVAATAEAFEANKELIQAFNHLHASDRLDNGHLTQLEAIGRAGFELTKAVFEQGDPTNDDYPGVFDYEVPPLFWGRYLNEYRRQDALPGHIWVHVTARSVVRKWLNPDPTWTAVMAGCSTPLIKSAPDIPGFLQHLKATGINLAKIVEIRQVPDGTD